MSIAGSIARLHEQREFPEESVMIERAILFVIGVPLAAAGLGLTAAFGVFAFIGMPLFMVGASCVSAAVESR